MAGRFSPNKNNAAFIFFFFFGFMDGHTAVDNNKSVIFSEGFVQHDATATLIRDLRSNKTATGEERRATHKHYVNINVRVFKVFVGKWETETN